jgi:tetratricopeptide (TPR) repeat protein
VFKGGGTLDAVEQICGDANQAQVRECLTSLVDKNMVVPREGQDGELHFTLLETIREFAVECLDKSGEFNRLRHQHAGYYARLAERAEGEIQGAKQVDWFERLQAERENVRSVLRWSSEETQTDYDLRLVAALGYYWYYDGQSIEEAKHWTELALSKSKNTTVELSAGVKMTAGRIAINYGDLQRSRAYLKESNALYHQLGDDNKAAWALVYLSMTHLDSEPEAVEGLRICEEGLLYFRNEHDRLGMSQALNILGELSRRLGNYEAARMYYEECQQMSRESGERLRIAMQYSNLASIAYRQMQPEKIGPFVKQAIQIYQELKNDYGVASAMPFMAGAAILTGKPEQGARILGACQAHLDEMGARYQPSDLLEIDFLAQETLRMSGETLFQGEWARGASMTFQETISYVLEDVE